MELFCPYCGVKGTAKDSLYTREVICLGCKKKFIIKCDVIVYSHHKTTEEKLSQCTDIPRDAGESEGIHVAKTPGTGEKKLLCPQEQEEQEEQKGQECSSCRAIIEKGTEYTLGNGVYCIDCVPVTHDMS